MLTLAACSAPGGMTLSDTPGQGNGYWTVVDGQAVWKVYRSGAPGRVPMQDRTFHSICGKMCRPHLPK